MPVRAGSLRHKITFEKVTRTSDGMGGWTEAWATDRKAWAAIWPLRGQEQFEAMKLEEKVTHRVRIRYWSGLTTEHRIKDHENKYYEIRNILDADHRHIYQDLMCEEIIEP